MNWLDLKIQKKSEQSYYRENNYIGTDGTVKKQNNNGHKPKVLIIKISVIG